MRILFVTLALPYPPVNGQRMRNWSLLRAMAEEGHSVSLVSFADTGGGIAPELRAVCREAALVPLAAGAANGGSWIRRLGTIALPAPHGVLRFRSLPMQREIARLARTCDIVLCDDIYQFDNLPSPAPVPVVLNKHDLTHVILRRYARYARNPLVRCYAGVESRKLRRWEARAAREADLVMVCSEVDRGELAELCPDLRSAIVTNVIDVADYHPSGQDDGRTILFFGSMEWLPNIDAVEYFVTQMLPQIRRQVPEAEFAVAGRNPPRSLCAKLAHIAGVRVTGSVPDLRPVIDQAAVCVVPLRIGSGTRLKILEAAALEKPVVSTALGAEGLELKDGRELLLAEAKEEFADAVAQLLKDRQRRRALGRAARCAVERQYSIAALRDALRAAFALFTPQSELSHALHVHT